MNTTVRDRRALMKLTGAGVAAFAVFNISNAKAQTMSNEWDKTFPKGVIILDVPS